jgi:hypothetical protein
MDPRRVVGPAKAFWPDLDIALPDKLYDRVNQYLERRLS